MHHFQGAKPKVVRPATANVNQGKIGEEQAGILRAMMQAHQQPRGGKNVTFGQRPKTAATTTVHDEKRIKDKMKFLENIFDKLDEDVLSTTGKIDLDFFRGKQNPGFKDAEKWKTGRRLTRKMVLNSALMCEELDEITTLMLRD